MEPSELAVWFPDVGSVVHARDEAESARHLDRADGEEDAQNDREDDRQGFSHDQEHPEKGFDFVWKSSSGIF